MANYPQELAQDAVCQSHTGHMTGLWFLPARSLRLNTNEWMNEEWHVALTKKIINWKKKGSNLNTPEQDSLWTFWALKWGYCDSSKCQDLIKQYCSIISQKWILTYISTKTSKLANTWKRIFLCNKNILKATIFYGKLKHSAQ